MAAAAPAFSGKDPPEDSTGLQEELVRERLLMGGDKVAKALSAVKANVSRDALCKSVFQVHRPLWPGAVVLSYTLHIQYILVHVITGAPT